MQLTFRQIPPYTLQDANLIANWFNQEDLRKTMSTWVRSRTHTSDSIAITLEESDPIFEHLFMIEVQEQNQDHPIIIGHAGIDGIDTLDKRAELFYCIGDSLYRGKGLSYQITNYLSHYAFNTLNLNSLIAGVVQGNDASMKPLIKNGFIQTGIYPEYNCIDGIYHDELLFSLTKKQYLTNSAIQQK